MLRLQSSLYCLRDSLTLKHVLGNRETNLDSASGNYNVGGGNNRAQVFGFFIEWANTTVVFVTLRYGYGFEQGSSLPAGMILEGAVKHYF